MKRFELKHCDSIWDLIWKFCDSIWKIAKSREIAKSLTTSKGRITWLFMPQYQPPGLPRLLQIAYGCVTDKQPTVSSVDVSSMQSLPLSYLVDECRLVFFRKPLVYDNIVIRTLVALPAVYYEYIGLCSKYDIKDQLSSRTYIKSHVFKAFCASVF